MLYRRQKNKIGQLQYFSLKNSHSYLKLKKVIHHGLPWRSSGLDSTLPLLASRIQPLVGELRSHMPWGTAKKKTAMKAILGVTLNCG